MTPKLRRTLTDRLMATRRALDEVERTLNCNSDDPIALEAWLRVEDSATWTFPLAPTCKKGCQYAEDVGMKGHSCGMWCQYLASDLRPISPLSA